MPGTVLTPGHPSAAQDQGACAGAADGAHAGGVRPEVVACRHAAGVRRQRQRAEHLAGGGADAAAQPDGPPGRCQGAICIGYRVHADMCAHLMTCLAARHTAYRAQQPLLVPMSVKQCSYCLFGSLRFADILVSAPGRRWRGAPSSPTCWPAVAAAPTAASRPGTRSPAPCSTPSTPSPRCVLRAAQACCGVPYMVSQAASASRLLTI